MTELEDFSRRLIGNVEKVIVGKRDAIELLTIALLSDGHVLIEDVPGVGKTMLARSFAISLGVEFKRLQCTPDLLPSDVTGVSIFDQKQQTFVFLPGPAFTNILLADEINRVTPRTQAALLEVMGERQITVDGSTHRLRQPFLVLATQNPIEFEGTFPLPEAQLDRFLMKISIGYPGEVEEQQMLSNLARAHPIESIGPVVDGTDLGRLTHLVWDVFVDDTVRDYIVKLVNACRRHEVLALGPSPRGGIALYRAAQARAAMQGRAHVLPDDVKALVPYVFGHRCLIDPEHAIRGRQVSGVIADILEQTPLNLGEP